MKAEKEAKTPEELTERIVAKTRAAMGQITDATCELAGHLLALRVLAGQLGVDEAKAVGQQIAEGRLALDFHVKLQRPNKLEVHFGLLLGDSRFLNLLDGPSVPQAPIVAGSDSDHGKPN